ncbi:hypothetical protein V6N13_041296 [Hibiscus sabdariffa]|uniref:Uncharacterized protein n=2 Tax=Hibiscus sabdariffa TaxID=183260 RepID=A0ABR2RAZ2_9ROSI
MVFLQGFHKPFNGVMSRCILASPSCLGSLGEEIFSTVASIFGSVEIERGRLCLTPSENIFRVDHYRSPCSSWVVLPLRFLATAFPLVLWMSSFGRRLPCSKIDLKFKDGFNHLIEFDS